MVFTNMYNTHTLRLKNGKQIIGRIKEIDFLLHTITLEVPSLFIEEALLDLNSFHIFDDDLTIDVTRESGTFLYKDLFYLGCTPTPVQTVLFRFHIVNMIPPTFSGKLLFVIPIGFKYYAWYDSSCENIKFNNRCWSLKNAKLPSENSCFFNIATELKNYLDDKLILVTDCEDYNKFNDILSDANSICNLMSFAFGTSLMWEYVWSEIAGNNEVLAYSNRALKKGNNSACIVQNAEDNFRHIALGDFIQKSCNRYQESPEWFNYIIQWYLNVEEACAIEVKIMICAMLLEAISKKFIKAQAPLIGNKLSEVLACKSKKRKLVGFFTEIMNFESNWQPKHTNIIFQLITNLNKEYSYIDAINNFFELGGHAPLTQTDKKIMKTRNKIMHQGLIIELDKVVECRKEVVFEHLEFFVNYCRAIILALLGYSGKFGKLDHNNGDKTDEVATIFPNWTSFSALPLN